MCSLTWQSPRSHSAVAAHAQRSRRAENELRAAGTSADAQAFNLPRNIDNDRMTKFADKKGGIDKDASLWKFKVPLRQAK
jgi:hypothetical protein